MTRTASSPERSVFSRTASVGQMLLKVSETFSAARASATEAQRIVHFDMVSGRRAPPMDSAIKLPSTGSP